MTRFATLVLLVAACGGPPASPLEDALSPALGPQSLVHGTLGASRKQASYAVQGAEGDVIAPDAWPTAGGALVPTLALFGPVEGGRRAALASGAPRGADPRHPAIDGFRLPRSGSYLLVVGLAPGSPGGRFSLRLWMQSSHLPRQEASQADLRLTPCAAAVAALSAHAASPHPWTDAEVDSVVSAMLREPDARVAFSSAQSLLSALAAQQATDAQRERASTAAAQLAGTQRRFRSLDPQTQAFALWWLGNADALLFSASPQAPPPGVDETVAQLVAAWPGAREEKSARTVQAKALNGVVYGWQVDWRAWRLDVDGTPVWVDSAREWFDSQGSWLAEESAGATEPDDD